jgi:hypothetical protein
MQSLYKWVRRLKRRYSLHTVLILRHIENEQGKTDVCKNKKCQAAKYIVSKTRYDTNSYWSRRADQVSIQPGLPVGIRLGLDCFPFQNPFEWMEVMSAVHECYKVRNVIWFVSEQPFDACESLHVRTTPLSLVAPESLHWTTN